MKVGILTISDRSARAEREDLSGPAIYRKTESLGWQIVKTAVVSDDRDEIEGTLTSWADSSLVDLVLTTGGTGFSPRDQAPEATLAVVERVTPGIAEAMRAAGLRKTPHAMLSRAVAGIRGATLIVNLPGSPAAALESLDAIAAALPHAIDLLKQSPDAEAGHTQRTKM